MNKRNIATVLWFMMGWTIGSVIAIAVGIPTVLGALVGIPFAAIVRRDPTGLLWTRDSQRRIRPRETVATTPGPSVPAN
jgi:hypothetical protein